MNKPKYFRGRPIIQPGETYEDNKNKEKKECSTFLNNIF